MKKNVLVTLANGDYVDQARQLFSSVYWNAGWKGDYVLLAHGIPESELVWFERKGIFVYRCEEVDGKNPADMYPMAVFSKLYLFKSYFKKWNKVVYLDADIIVTDSLEDLERVRGFGAKSDFHTDLHYQINLCCNPSVIDMETWLEKNVPRLGAEYDLATPAFNSGVMVLNTDLITENSFDELLTLANKYRDMLNFGDQLALNLFMYRAWQPIEDYCNAFVLEQRAVRAFFNQQVVMPVLHFVSISNKPWRKNHTFRKIWLDNLSKAEDIDLRVVPAPKTHSPEKLAWSRMMVTKNERVLVARTKDWKAFKVCQRLSRLYQRKEMRQFRRLLIRVTFTSYSRRYNPLFLCFFASYFPQNLKDRTNAVLRKLRLRSML